MTLQIEEGKFYRTRDGQKIGPMRKTLDHAYPWRAPQDMRTGFATTWAADGRFHMFSEDIKFTRLDLIAEWVDEPASDVSGFTADDVMAEDTCSEEQREADHYDPVRVLKDWLSAAGWDRGRGWKDGDPPIIRRVKEAVRRAEQTSEPQPATKKSVLEAAIQTVADRGVPYGGVEDNFNRIAELWSSHVKNRYSEKCGLDVFLPQFDAADVAMMMALMKIARLEANPSHADSWIDVAGYAACGGEIGAKLTLDKSE